ncbi:GNAT family N-acetyltransferase [Clostridium estertheticum]|uniref:GNAT family N-acetyltransferase n=1 Tax=Clostridium estertheticum TaxID=238834 RepID=UPI001C0C91EF|nr:GNAT family N-acetyltransferase [Clostridium estertheticum]MBU3175243.1 GNAT family N-acetyltransferase [Clostridium estertheticum]
MQDLVLKKVAIEYCDGILSYKDEFIYNNESMDGTGFLRNANSPQEYIEKSLLNETEEVDGGKVTATQLLAIRKSDNCIVGMIQIRHFLNDYLLQYGGHIGYSVRKSERNKGYAKEELRQALTYCKDILHISRVLLTCDNDNLASQKTILAQGGKKENEVVMKDDNCVVERYWIDL